MSEIPGNNLTAQEPQSPEAKRKHAGGRKPKGYYERAVQDILDGSAPKAAILLDRHLDQTRGYKTIKDSVLKICFYVIDHAIGKSKQKIEHSGGILSYDALAKSAEDMEKKPPDVLAEVEEVANKTPGIDPL